MMLTILMKLTILILFVLVIMIYFKISNNINDERHLTMNHNYAHFSKINMTNFFLYPNFLFLTHPMTFTLKEGDSLYIPKKWWHWVITTKKTKAINFWIKSNSNINPFIMNNLYSNDDRILLLQKINNTLFDNKINIWNSSYNKRQTTNKLDGSCFLNMNNDNKYFITLDGYSRSNLEDNKEIKRKIINEIKPPSYILNNNLIINDINIWISSNYNDTGLHYDDNDGILYVLNGEKEITLYPPTDSIYLEPYSVLPNYALQKPIFMYYNENTIVDENVDGLPSELILLKSLEYMSKSKLIFQKIQKIYDKKENNKKLIWGCKKQNDTYRWEVYYYHYKPNNINSIYKGSIRDLFIEELTESTIYDLYKDNVIIHSIDILNDNIENFNNELHTYECDKERNLPLYGSGYDYIDNKKIKVGEFIYDTYENCLLNSSTYFKELGLEYNEKIKNMLTKYNAINMCIWNKKGDYFIQWLTISIDDFISFLEEFHYNEEFVEYIKNNRDQYINISHEITIVFDKNDVLPLRSGFYGCL